MPQKVRSAVVGATGYAGFELVRLLLRHPQAETPVLLGRMEEQEPAVCDLAELYPHLSGNGRLRIEPFSWELLDSVDVLFLATPHEYSRQWMPELVSRGVRVVDLSGAWRLKCEKNRAVYGFEDKDESAAAALTDTAVYGLPELHGPQVARAQVVANPGCYATSVILALAPLTRAGLIDREQGVICDAKSGVSGAGKRPTAKTHFVEVADNLAAYSVFAHRHTGEILEQTGLNAEEIVFTPHLLPIPRGILTTLYFRLTQSMTAEEMEQVLREFYREANFVRVYPANKLPQIQYSLRTNHCDLGFCLDEPTRRVVMVSCLDNLMKGAAGQALQNMNLMFGLEERGGLN